MEAVFNLYVICLKRTRKHPPAVTSKKADVIEYFQKLSLRWAILSESKAFTSCEMKKKIELLVFERK